VAPPWSSSPPSTASPPRRSMSAARPARC
jgi:hypothetical protein